MAGLYVFHADDSDNVARLCSGNFVPVIRVHLNHSADTFGFSGVGVKDGVAFIQYAGVNPYEGQCAKTVFHNFESQCSKRLFGRNRSNFACVVTFFIGKWLRFYFGWAWQVVNNGVQD